MTVTKLPVQNKNIKRAQFNFEVKQILEEQDGFFRFEGLASTFGNIDLVGDIVERGAFRKSLEEKMPIVLWQHFSSEPIGMPEIVTEISEGLFIRARLPLDDTLVNGRVVPQIKVGSIKTMSIGFRVISEEIGEDGIRRLKELDLLEFSLVTFAANPKATITSFKNLFDDLSLTKEQKEKFDCLLNQKPYTLDVECLDFLDNIQDVTVRNLEKSLRDSGLFTKNAAKKMVSFLNRCDAENKDIDTYTKELKKINDEIVNYQVQNEIRSMLLKFGD